MTFVAESRPRTVRLEDDVSTSTHREPARHAVSPERVSILAYLLWTLVGVGIAMALFWVSLRQFDLDAAGATGIVHATPLTYVAAVGVLALTFALLLGAVQSADLAIGVTVAALVVVLFGVPNLVEGTGSMSVGYLHVGFAEYIEDHHAVPSGVDARFSWPAFFTATAYVTNIAGLPDARPLLPLAPVFFQLLALLPMLVLARRILGSGRAAWIAVVLYYCGTWFGQDYLAPQAVVHVLYLTLMAVLLWTVGPAEPRGLLWAMRHPGAARQRPGLPLGMSEGAAFAVQLVLTFLIAALVVTHQLTPVGLIIQLGVLAALSTTRYRLLWLSTGLMFLTWFSYGAVEFWRGHLKGILENLGAVGSSVDKGLTSRLSEGDPTYLRMQYLRTLWSGVFLALGGVGALVLLRRRAALTVTVGALGLAPFVLVALQSYGGEVILRCFLYAMPFLAVLSAAALSPLLRLPPALRVMTFTVVVLLSGLVLVAMRNVNMAFEAMSRDEVQAAEFTMTTAPEGATIGVYEAVSPLGYTGIKTHRVAEIGPAEAKCAQRLLECAEELDPDYLFLSTTQERYGQVKGRMPADWLMRDGVAALVDAGEYRVIHENEHAVVLLNLSPSGGDAKTSKTGEDAELKP